MVSSPTSSSMLMGEKDLFGLVVNWELVVTLLDFLVVALALVARILVFLLVGLPPLGVENTSEKGESQVSWKEQPIE